MEQFIILVKKKGLMRMLEYMTYRQTLIVISLYCIYAVSVLYFLTRLKKERNLTCIVKFIIKLA